MCPRGSAPKDPHVVFSLEVLSDNTVRKTPLPKIVPVPDQMELVSLIYAECYWICRTIQSRLDEAEDIMLNGRAPR